MNAHAYSMTAPAEVYRQRRARLAASLSRPLVVFAGHAPARNYPTNPHPFRAGSTYLARGARSPRITGKPKTVKYLASSLLKCMNRVERDGESRICSGSLNGSPTRSARSPYTYRCNTCNANAIAGPMVDRQIQLLLLAKLGQAQAKFRKPEAVWSLEPTLSDCS